MYKEYCSGCGLCSSIKKASLETNESGFKRIADENECLEFCEQVCPAGGKQCDTMDFMDIWGRTKQVYLSYSTDDEIRYAASSGGVLTGICCYMLKEHVVDAIIHTGEDTNNPIATVTLCSSTKEEVMRGCGSRYSSSTPLQEIGRFLESDKKYAFVGKPCDVTALKNYAELDDRVNQRIPYMLSFFCAGAPSRTANIELLKKMGCDHNDCRSLKYRGDGWPGYATAVDTMNKTYQMPYRMAWRDTLGRDIRLMCRFCIDGIGELADISCGDAWFLGEDRKPVFDETDGRNVVFCRTDKGMRLFAEVCKAGYLNSEVYEDYKNDIKCYQQYQYLRRAAMRSTIAVLKLMGREHPHYNKKLLTAYETHISIKSRLRRAYGIYQRVKKGMIG